MIDPIARAALDQIIVVLHRPRNIVNIGGVVRTMKNMEFRHLRLVAPGPFTAANITAIAHRSEDIIESIRTYDDLDSALADTVYVVGTTEHFYNQHSIRTDIRALAPELVQRAVYGPVALLFGPEDNGLDSRAFDRCHTIVRLPTNPAYPSLNLSHAVVLLLYELRMATGSDIINVLDRQDPANTAQLETLFSVWEQALHTIEFFKSPQTESVMGPLRAVIHRASPDRRETALLTAMAREIVHFCRRTGRKT